MKKLTLADLDDLVIGSAILGSGGGGDPTYAYLMARYEMEKQKPLHLISLAELKPKDLIVPVGFMGAPMAEMEKIPTGREFVELFKVIEKEIGRKIDVIMPFEIGGSNAFIPLMVGVQTGLPVVDADLMGRAFPEAYMTSTCLQGISPSPGFLNDSQDNVVVIHAKSNASLEKIGRHATMAMGSSSACCFYILHGAEEAKKSSVPKSVSKATAIGKTCREAKQKGKDPLESILNLCKGVLIGSGKISDIDRVISQGFLQGTVVIQNDHEKIEIIFQNEYLVAKYDGQIVATTPDILMLLEQETGTPITSEWLQYGLKVNVIALPSPEIWTSPEGLALVGPRKFGYEIEYKPISKSRNKFLFAGTGR